MEDVPHKASKNFLLEVAHNTPAHIIGQNRQLAKTDIKKGGRYHLSRGKSL